MVQSDNSNTIVIVDDEDMVLTSIDAFLQLESNYTIKTFTSAKNALDFIEKNGTSLIISDYLMPEMDGIQFLAKARKIKPEIPRIILTGYADKENAIKAINEVGLFQYIEKPWDNDNLLLVIRNGIEKFQLVEQLQNKIKEINEAYDDLHGMQKVGNPAAIG